MFAQFTDSLRARTLDCFVYVLCLVSFAGAQPPTQSGWDCTTECSTTANKVPLALIDCPAPDKPHPCVVRPNCDPYNPPSATNQWQTLVPPRQFKYEQACVPPPAGQTSTKNCSTSLNLYCAYDYLVPYTIVPLTVNCTGGACLSGQSTSHCCFSLQVGWTPSRRTGNLPSNPGQPHYSDSECIRCIQQ